MMDSTSEERFKQIVQAYEVLGDKEQRNQYDEIMNINQIKKSSGNKGSQNPFDP